MNQSSKDRKPYVIACAVLALDIKAAAEKLGTDIGTRYLEGGLHDRPHLLREKLQAAIDEISASGRWGRIMIGYGVCGRGTVGIQSRNIPLSIPKVHDCMALFLGGDREYQRQFKKYPGTYYISAGWYEEKTEPFSQQKKTVFLGDHKLSYEELVDKYGAIAARETYRFLSTWKQNYQRAAFIETGAKRSPKYENHAREMARAYGWRYEKIPGDHALIEKLLSARATTDEILVVPPNHVIQFDSLEATLSAKPVWADPKAPQPDTETIVLDDEQRPAESTAYVKIGLGIDAGGTYTDTVLYDFEQGRTICKSKALTTKWDFTVGIHEALAKLDPPTLRQVEMVSLSTTLATNAIVEGEGQKVGLIIMPPYGRFDTADIAYEPKVAIAGQLEISGAEIAPVDEAQVKQIVRRMVKKDGVQAFAVSGYGGSVNPVHEIEAKRIIEQETGCDVCCGHELSAMLDFRIRANTAVLNAGIIPLLERFLEDVQRVLDRRRISAAVMVVKGDGTLMQSDYARQHPVETILSGPAASIAGARYLTDTQNATVIDVGGTTSDIGKLRDGNVRICGEGAEVGHWRTHVQAIDMRTVGLGGDSEVGIDKQRLFVGPRRIAPVSWLAARWKAADREAEFSWLEDRLDDFAADTRRAEMLWATGRTPTFEPNAHERDVLKALEVGPASLLHLVDLSGCGHIQLLRTERLEAEHIVQRCGLTPTDVLHVVGRLDLWDADAANRYTDLIARIRGNSKETLAREVMDLVTEKLIFELVRRQLEHANGNDDLEHSPTAKGIVDVLLAGGNRHLNVILELSEPVIGLGAAAPLFLGEAATHLHARLEIPDYADVANAVGAITSMVSVSQTGSVVPSPDGTYRLAGIAGGARFDSFDDAYRALLRELERAVVADAEAAGTDERTVAVDVHDRMSTTADGTEVFLERQVVTSITGAPRTARV